MKTIKVKFSWKYFFRRVFLLTVLVSLLLLLATCFRPASISFEYVPYKVSAGESLWSIAENQSEGIDVRKVLFELKAKNGMIDSNLYEGQTILVPGVLE